MNDYSKQWRGDRGSWLEIEIVGSEAAMDAIYKVVKGENGDATR